MSDSKPSEDFREFEERMHFVVNSAIASNREGLEAAGYEIKLDPVSRTGEGSSYSSYLEATIAIGDEIDDVLFAYLVREGKLAVGESLVEDWITRALAELLEH